MPLIEELPLSTPSRAQPGWAYVPEVSAQAAAAAAAAAASATTATTSRKRNRGLDTLGSQNAKQQKAIEQRLKDLEKENYKDVQIAIPRREGATATTTTTSTASASAAKAAKAAKTSAAAQHDGKKTSSNARRILGYNRTFAHYLADEEAAMQAGQQPYYYVHPGSTINLPAAAAAGHHSRDRDRNAKQRQPSRKRADQVKIEQQPGKDVDMSGLPSSQTQPAASASEPAAEAAPAPAPASTAPPYPAHWDKDPLLQTRGLPARPSARVMAQLVAEPALSWNEARAKPQPPPTTTSVPVPARHFCSTCGYWGKIKCRKCGERVCGVMECWRAHEAAAGCGDRPY